jgi:phosphate uptake regulator
VKRRIVQLGNSTLVISLPAKWSKKYGLKAGEELEIEEQERALKISTSKEFETTKTTVDLTTINNLMKRFVAARYLAGYDIIDVRFDNINKARQIQKRAKDLIGMQVVNESKDTLELREISRIDENSFEPILRRVFLMLLAISEESEKAILASQTNLEYIKDMEENINNFTDYCFRILNKKGYTKYAKTPSVYCLINNLELMADEYKKLVSYITDNELKLSADNKKLYSDISKLLRSLYDCYYKFSNDSAIEIAISRDKIIKNIENSINKTKSVKESILLNRFYNIAELIINTLGHILIIEG